MYFPLLQIFFSLVLCLLLSRNLSYDTIEDDLKELMSEIGDVAYVKMVIDRNTDHSKGKENP